ncbi:competence/damage-inducible protein CinA [Pseudopedobacter saltans DSM 12145]|uniref:CinA-like protein n=1 Tax=Pseudopedobacter saltans (strain ATCC 51119 / DSM 12145 / JCM 21818 / CCUG 39354 / LMG 10337 / NBRC 100064 / NCIMB 13643) TaxID=762903 RepID=F0S4J2_PSESL|nr:competence/damage-inducible protein A [Pseudopedobacter saltans]ADY51983.1 competence/damage-inducible protein CinA [Pseudopedobacter saltans DSM 12145]
MPLAEIITIGDEILIGQIIDTNSPWMATELNKIGISVTQITSISDQKEHILKALEEAEGRADIILVTGGLGPTKDDVTKKTMAEYFGSEKMVVHEPTLKIVRSFFERRDLPVTELNALQAEVPDNCEILLNENGTAPCMLFQKGNKVFISMPGVPFEMMLLMSNKVLPELTKRYHLPSIYHRTILTAGIGESFLADRIADIEDSLPDYIKLAYLPKLGMVRLRLSSAKNADAELIEEIEQFAGKIEERVAEYWVSNEDVAFEKAILDLMERNNLTLSLAESCTGGYLSHLFTQHSGSSSVFDGAAVVYSNKLKMSVLGVKSETLEQFGAVSEQTAKEMAEGALLNFETDFAVAITGIAGPGGGSEEKPVGTVCIAVANKNETLVKRFIFSNKRLQNIERSATAALFLLLTLLRKSQYN